MSKINFYQFSSAAIYQVPEKLKEFYLANPDVRIEVEALNILALLSPKLRKAYLIYLWSRFAERSQTKPEKVIKIFVGNYLAGVTCISGKNSRFPFMRNGDIQFGNVLVDTRFRGRNLAYGMVLYGLLLSIECNDRWYLVADENVPSIRVAEKCGFELVGYGSRGRPSGRLWRPLGIYDLQK